MQFFRRGTWTGALVWVLPALMAWGQATPSRAQVQVPVQASASAQAIAQRGVTLARQGNFGAAVAAYGRALAIDPELAGARMDLALAYFKTGQIEAAARNFRKYLALKP
ncbi:MAG: tetratricopeptide repeat protein, partial [Terriglobales bacterium]